MSSNALTIQQAHEGLVAKKFSAVELTEDCLSHIEKTDGALHAFLDVHASSALGRAKEVDEKIAKGLELKPLEGIPVAIKDNMLLAGTVTTAGSKILEAYVAPYDATVIIKLKAAGAIILGKTNMDDSAMGTTTESSAFGPTFNPWDITRIPGGSSGGSAAAVAANECIYALGSDTGGSIRQPAGMCGVVGLKPTYGAVSRYGLIAMSSSLDQIGPLTKSVEDAAIVFDAIKGSDIHDSSSRAAQEKPIHQIARQSISGMKIGLPKEYFIEGLDARIEKKIREACDVLHDVGAEIIDISLPHAPYALSAYYIICPAEISANFSRLDGIRYGYSAKDARNLSETYCRSREEGLGTEVRRRIMLGSYVLAAGYYDAYYKKAQAVRQMVRRDFDNAFRTVDCIVSPTSPTPAFRIGEKISDPLTLYLEDIFTVSANMAGIPGLVVPAGFVEEGGVSLPVGLQLLGRHFDEETILCAGYAYEQATDWHTRKSPLS
ncbi:Asp-tRNA(Asn)/Glu-tRNA(Gln) amidotransferase subunit GatA [Candidatus Uhrbacteria bacterium]|nr:Asp-tRNA(Asn)/Glu-tRNA(Gln) amidotransferase subunit GatA [Candidatus Uhrbacteria bacterium]